MNTEVKIPAVGESIVSGLLSTWHRKEGETVKAGDVLFTLETDKVSSDVVAEQGGVLRIKVPEGTEVKIGEVVALISGEAAPSQAPAPADSGSQPSPGPQSAPEDQAKPGSAPARPTVPSAPPPDVSRAAREISAEMFVGPSTLSVAQEPTDERRVTRRKLSPIRRKIAAQLVMAQQNAAILTTFNEVDMSGVMSLRSRLQDSFVKQHGVKLGFMSFFVKATVRALKDVPSINGRIDGEDFVQNHFFDIGVAVGTERGLVVPVIRDADAKSFARLEQDLVEFAGRARDGKLKVDELQGGVFTISNGGVYGSLLSTPILNPPQSGILGMHKIQERPVVVEGQVVIRPMMYLALSYDHRVVDGKEAVTFLIRVKECLEDPARLLVEA